MWWQLNIRINHVYTFETCMYGWKQDVFLTFFRHILDYLRTPAVGLCAKILINWWWWVKNKYSHNDLCSIQRQTILFGNFELPLYSSVANIGCLRHFQRNMYENKQNVLIFVWICKIPFLSQSCWSGLSIVQTIYYLFRYSITWSKQ